MSKRLYTYIPEHPLSCGELGEHSGQFLAEIDCEENRFGKSWGVNILKVIVDIRYDGGKIVTVDVTPAFTKLDTIRKSYEDEILRDYLCTLNKELDHREGLG